MAGPTSEDLAKFLKDAEDTVRRQDKDIQKLRKEKVEDEAVIKDLQEQFRLATEANQKLNDIITKLTESPDQGPRASRSSWDPTKEQLAKYLKDAEETVRLQYEQIQRLQQLEWQQQTKQLAIEKAQAEEDRDKFEIEKQQEREAKANLQDVIQELKAKFNEVPIKEDECSCRKTRKLKQTIQFLNNELKSITAQLDETVSNCIKEKQDLEDCLRTLQEELQVLKGSTSEYQ